MQRLLIYITMCIFLTSCILNSGTSVHDITAFDIPAWLDSKTHLNDIPSDARCKKTVSMDSITENTFITITDFDSSLQILKELDLNNPMYAGKLTTDTTWQSDSVEVLNYTTTSTKVPIRACHIRLLHEQVTSIEIITEENNLLYKVHKEYNYFPGKSFTISVAQRTIFYGEKHYSLQYTIVQ